MFSRHRLYLSIIAGSLLLLLVAGCAAGPTAGGFAAAPSAAAQQVDQQPMPRTVSVNGFGSATAAPDLANVVLGVQISDTNADLVVQQSTDRMNAVMNVIEDMGIADEDVQTTQYNMTAQQQFDKDGQPTGEVTYRITNQVRVTVRDLSRVGELLQRTLEAGANTVGGITFDIEDPEALQQQARDQAIADAQAKAQQLASGLGVQLGAVREVSEFGGGQPAPREVRMEAAQAAGAVPVSGGELSVSVQIQVVFDLAE